MTVAVLLTYHAEPDCFDEVLSTIRAHMIASQNTAGLLDRKLFSSKEDNEIRSFSIWSSTDAFYAYMDEKIDDGAFSDQGRLLQKEVDCRIFKPESL